MDKIKFTLYIKTLYIKILYIKILSNYEFLNMGGEYGTKLGACLGNIDQFGGL